MRPTAASFEGDHVTTRMLPGARPAKSCSSSAITAFESSYTLRVTLAATWFILTSRRCSLRSTRDLSMRTSRPERASAGAGGDAGGGGRLRSALAAPLKGQNYIAHARGDD